MKNRVAEYTEKSFIVSVHSAFLAKHRTRFSTYRMKSARSEEGYQCSVPLPVLNCQIRYRDNVRIERDLPLPQRFVLVVFLLVHVGGC